jgi:hypothetical protein
MLRFTGQPEHEKVLIGIQYRPTQDHELTTALIQAIQVLVTAVGEARVRDISGEPESERWLKEFLLGFSLLTVGEARSLLLLLGDNLNRHARVHLRSIYEYELRAKILLKDPAKALAFRDSLAYEMREAFRHLSAQSEAVNQQIAVALGVNDASTTVGAKESVAFGGTVRDQMRDEIAPEKRYAGTFAWASRVSHGSILALHELWRAVDGSRSDLLFRATSDEKGNDLLYYVLWPVLWFAGALHEKFGVRVSGLEDTIKRALDANQRLNIVSSEHEAATVEAREKHLHGK